MRKIIKGKLYDTDTATVISRNSNDLSYRDFRWCERTLYRKKNGEFFEFGEGGAMTIYSVFDVLTNSRRNGSAIRPLTDDEARSWLEKYGSVEEYEYAFGRVSE